MRLNCGNLTRLWSVANELHGDEVCEKHGVCHIMLMGNYYHFQDIVYLFLMRFVEDQLTSSSKSVELDNAPYVVCVRYL